MNEFARHAASEPQVEVRNFVPGFCVEVSATSAPRRCDPELTRFLDQYSRAHLDNGHRALNRGGDLLVVRTLQTDVGVGDDIRAPGMTQLKIKAGLPGLWAVLSRDASNEAFDITSKRYANTYPKDMPTWRRVVTCC